MIPTIKNVIARLDSRELRADVEVDFPRLGEEGYSKLYAALASESGLKPRQLANGVMLLFVARTLGDANKLFELALVKLKHEDERVRSSAARVVVALLYMRGHVPKLSFEDRTAAKGTLRQSQKVGLDEKTDALVQAFFDGTLAW